VSVPSFLVEKTVDIEIGGRALRFYAVSAPVLFRLQAALGAPLAKLLSSIYAGQAHDGALGALVEAIGANSEIAATLVLDALHEEPWVKRPVTKAAVEEFLAAVSGPSLVSMLAGVVRVNAEAFGPLAVGLLDTVTRASSPQTPTSGGAI
jgi:hypothetical protein